MRDSNGKFIMVFSRRFGFCSVLEAELWGIMYGLQMAAEAKREHLHVSADSLQGVMLIDDFMHSKGERFFQIRRT